MVFSIATDEEIPIYNYKGAMWSRMIHTEKFVKNVGSMRQVCKRFNISIVLQ